MALHPDLLVYLGGQAAARPALAPTSALFLRPLNFWHLLVLQTLPPSYVRFLDKHGGKAPHV
jgi:hypothetical protein